MSRGVRSSCLFLASVEDGSTFQKIGTVSRAITATCKQTASAWLVPKCTCVDQWCFTLIGLIPGGNGACLGGEKKSRMRPPNPPKLAPHATSSLLFIRRLGDGPDLKNSQKLPPIPEPNDVCVKGASLRSRTLTGRAVRNCFRFDQKLSAMRISGLPKLGTALTGTGIAGAARAVGTSGVITERGRWL